MPNGSHSSGPDWGDVLRKSDVKEIVREEISVIIDRLNRLENELAKQDKNSSKEG